MIHEPGVIKGVVLERLVGPLPVPQAISISSSREIRGSGDDAARALTFLTLAGGRYRA